MINYWITKQPHAKKNSFKFSVIQWVASLDWVHLDGSFLISSRVTCVAADIRRLDCNGIVQNVPSHMSDAWGLLSDGWYKEVYLGWFVSAPLSSLPSSTLDPASAQLVFGTAVQERENRICKTFKDLGFVFPQLCFLWISLVKERRNARECRNGFYFLKGKNNKASLKK